MRGLLLSFLATIAARAADKVMFVATRLTAGGKDLAGKRSKVPVDGAHHIKRCGMRTEILDHGPFTIGQ